MSLDIKKELQSTTVQQVGWKIEQKKEDFEKEILIQKGAISSFLVTLQEIEKFFQSKVDDSKNLYEFSLLKKELELLLQEKLSLQRQELKLKEGALYGLEEAIKTCELLHQSLQEKGSSDGIHKG